MFRVYEFLWDALPNNFAGIGPGDPGMFRILSCLGEGGLICRTPHYSCWCCHHQGCCNHEGLGCRVTALRYELLSKFRVSPLITPIVVHSIIPYLTSFKEFKL